jgi:cation transport regulator
MLATSMAGRVVATLSLAQRWRQRLWWGEERTMPYDKLSELPDSVRDNLPKHAQEIYRAAYNSAWDQYKSAEDRRGDASREETAHRVAWSAVKEKYEKKGERWVKKD